MMQGARNGGGIMSPHHQHQMILQQQQQRAAALGHNSMMFQQHQHNKHQQYLMYHQQQQQQQQLQHPTNKQETTSSSGESYTNLQTAQPHFNLNQQHVAVKAEPPSSPSGTNNNNNKPVYSMPMVGAPPPPLPTEIKTEPGLDNTINSGQSNTMAVKTEPFSTAPINSMEQFSSCKIKQETPQGAANGLTSEFNIKPEPLTTHEDQSGLMQQNPNHSMPAAAVVAVKSEIKVEPEIKLEPPTEPDPLEVVKPMNTIATMAAGAAVANPIRTGGIATENRGLATLPNGLSAPVTAPTGSNAAPTAKMSSPLAGLEDDEAWYDGNTFQCLQCLFVSKSMDHFNAHVYNYHKQVNSFYARLSEE